MIENLINNLNNSDVNVRLNSLKELYSLVEQGKINTPVATNDVNNHIHTNYSFSPYSPTKALWLAYTSGLTTAGIMDHDSISGAEEFIKAGEIINMATTIGVECRASMANTKLSGKRINNPDQKSVAYMAIHGISHIKIDRVKSFFEPYIKARNVRNIKMVEKINEIINPFGLNLSFEQDVIPLSNLNEGGSITERHILFALSKKIVEKFGKGEKLVVFVKNELKIMLSSKIEQMLLDKTNEYYEYDLLGALKSDMVAQFYINATDECPDVCDVIALAKEVSGIAAYAYLGDVTDSVTGDKKTQKFEDDYLELLFEVISSLSFNAVTYMPSRNSIDQLKRLKGLCEKYGFFQISGEDINSPRQKFVCDALKNPEFSNLIDSTWGLIGHEMSVTEDLEAGLFSPKIIERYPNLNDRINVFKAIAKSKFI